jgi:hypothetical protein
VPTELRRIRGPNVKAWQGNYDTLLKKESAFSFERNQDHDELSFYHWPHFVPTGAALPANDGWHHVAATFDGVEQNIYLDGELVSQMEILGNIDVNDAPVYIGSNGTTRHLLATLPVRQRTGLMRERALEWIVRYDFGVRHAQRPASH